MAHPALGDDVPVVRWGREARVRHNPGPLVDLGCICHDACECDEACEHWAYYFEDDGRQVCEDCFGTLNDEVFDDDE